MLRFCGKRLLEQSEGIIIVMAEQHLMFNEQIWHDGREYFKRNICYDIVKIPIIPIIDASGKIICYGWQDNEANRELRMLRELEKDQNAKQFGDVFPDVTEVVICGCNELAYHFVRYLERLNINVSIYGRYWDYLGYKSVENIDFEDSSKMIIKAEHILENQSGLFQRVVRSASSEFECIDRIYEENILAGNIRDTEGDFNTLVGKLSGRDVVILGTDAKAQDAYDWLLVYGIDIKCFAVSGTHMDRFKMLLGKKIETTDKLLCDENNFVFVEVNNINSAWGNKDVEIFDYYGYERNERFFLLMDYVDIPCSNLIHVLQGKKVALIGDERLCKILSNYLVDIEEGDIVLQYVEALRNEIVDESDVLCEVDFWYGQEPSDRKPRIFEKYKGLVSYTDYYSRPSVFVYIDQHRIETSDKYTVKQLTPKGILLNSTFYNSGNVFFMGLMDGHPDILLIPFNVFAYNLFSYCIRLSIEKAEDIPDIFHMLLKKEMSESEFKETFPCWSGFRKSLEEWLSLHEIFTSQELFIIFHIAYTEMMGNGKIENLTQKVIYFDPHGFFVYNRPFLAKWLESGAVNTQVITIHRDDVTNVCSFYARSVAKDGKMKSARDIVRWMCCEKMNLGIGQVDFQYCKRYEVRFEDLKLHPREELLKICERIGIPWSDTLLHTTYFGNASSMGTIRDFDLKPIFNKHEAYWSEFDRFRLYLIMSPYQKRYGYPYENCMKFSRVQLWDFFLKDFDFQRELHFRSMEDKASYYLWVYETVRWQLYENRKHVVMDDIKPKFKPIEIGKTENEIKMEKLKLTRTERHNLVEIVSSKKKFVLYGLGRDGRALWDCLDEVVRSSLVLCDRKAEKEVYYFQDKQVISPLELRTKYKDYKILVTSSQFYKAICAELDDMGINADRIICNTVQLWEGDDKLG